MPIQILSNLNHPIYKTINSGLENANKTQIATAFLKMSGIRQIEKSLKQSLSNNGQVEIIAGLDFKTTEASAMSYFLDLKEQYQGFNFYCYGDTQQNKTSIVFHPKIYLFENTKDFVTIIGSSNLTKGGLCSNLEVNTVFQENKPLYYLQAEAIYKQIKWADSVFIPDKEYILNYKNIFKVLQKNKKITLLDETVAKEIALIKEQSKTLPSSVASIKLMIVEYMKAKLEEGVLECKTKDICENILQRIKKEGRENQYQSQDLNATIRGEINMHEMQNKYKNNLQLFKRVRHSFYTLTDFGKTYKGR